MTMTQQAAPAIPSRGRTRVTERALDRVTAAVAADTLGVDARAVRVTLGDDHGSLVLEVNSPIRVVALAQVHADPTIVTRTGGSITERADSATTEIGTRVADLTGSAVATVKLRLTGTVVAPPTRVR